MLHIFSLFIDGKNSFRLYLVPMSKLKDGLGKNKTLNWKMDAKAVSAYQADAEIASFEFSYDTPLWGALK